MILVSLTGSLLLGCWVLSSFFVEQNDEKTLKSLIGFGLVILGCMFGAISWSLGNDTCLGFCKFLRKEDSEKFLVGFGFGVGWAWLYFFIELLKFPKVIYFTILLPIPLSRMFFFYYIDKKAGLNLWSDKKVLKDCKAQSEEKNENNDDIKNVNKVDVWKKSWTTIINFPLGQFSSALTLYCFNDRAWRPGVE